jgi:Flp pilus assembly protein TadG
VNRLRGEESGAVLMIVAICLIVLLGMLVLTVDLGRMVAIKRSMVRGADAAALAAAQQCAAGNGIGAATTAANLTAGLNVDGVDLVSIDADNAACAGGPGQELVTVKYTTAVDMFFAPIFGIDTSNVVAQATASWSAPRPIPITVNAVPLEACEEQPNEVCVLDYHKDDLSEPRWGTLDLGAWGQQDATSCPASADEITGIIEDGGWPTRLSPNPPTWDCLDNGRQFSSWASLEGRTLWFPIIDIPNSTGFVKPGADVPCMGSDIPALEADGKTCQITTGWIIGFKRMTVLSVETNGDTTILHTQLERERSSIPGMEIRLVD